jgi:HAD superfamily hydrolase (TIGR01490 family)
MQEVRMSRRLALFDLDNTLLEGDSDHAWGEFLISRNLVDANAHRAENDSYYRQYQEGKLDIHGYVKFTMAPILQLSSAKRKALHEVFMRETVAPMVLDKALALVKQHRDAGDYCLIITATNAFITSPIAAIFGVDQLIATELEIKDDCLTGNIAGTPCYQAGKVAKLEQWLLAQRQPQEQLSLANSIFYTDSVNDLQLLKQVKVPVAVDPDDQLRSTALEKRWDIISLRG